MLTFLKLGGSLITDKANSETVRPDRVARAVQEIAAALKERPDLALLIGHGSGSFGHIAAKQYRTQDGVSGAEAWRGFARVATVAARLNQIILDSLDDGGVPVFRIQPSASSLCAAGQLVEMATRPIETALSAGLVPLIYGDVSVDEHQGGTINSTEAIFAYLAPILKPRRILLAGDYDGVLDSEGRIIRRISPATLPEVSQLLGGSVWTDVTGGMASKVRTMLELCQRVPDLSIHIFSGETPGQIKDSLTAEVVDVGTCLSA